MNLAISNFKNTIGSEKTLLKRSDNQDLTIMYSYGIAIYRTPLKSDFSNYQVPVGKQLRVIGLDIRGSYSSSSYTRMAFGYGDGASNSSSLPANNVNTSIVTPFSTTNVESFQQCDFIIPAGKYPFIGTASATFEFSVTWYCIEEDV